MKRYLLFDAGCSVCNQLARAIEEAAGGKLEAVSIHDPQAREWLSQAYPAGWAHRPYLVTIDGEQVRASTGVSMALRLGWLLGPRKGWRVWNLARQHGVVLPVGGAYSAERRGFLKRAAAFMAGVFFFPRFGATADQNQTKRGRPEGKTPYVFFRVPLDDPAISALKNTAAVQTAMQHFGRPKWDEVYRIEYRESAQVAYMIPCPEGGKITFLVIGDPASGPKEIALVGQMTLHRLADGQPMSEMKWFTPGGRLVGSMTVSGGSAAGSSYYPEVAEPLGLNWNCFLACVRFLPAGCYGPLLFLRWCAKSLRSSLLGLCRLCWWGSISLHSGLLGIGGSKGP